MNTSVELSDHDTKLIIEQIKGGNREGFKRLYDRFLPSLQRIFLQILGNVQDSEDALNEFFISVLRDIKTFEEQRGKFTSWLYQCARNRAVDVLRKKNRVVARHERFGYFLRADQSSFFSAPRAPDDSDDEYGLLVDFLKRCPLSDEARRVIQMWCLEEKTHEQISRELGKPQGTIKAHLRRGFEKLRKHAAEDLVMVSIRDTMKK